MTPTIPLNEHIKNLQRLQEKIQALDPAPDRPFEDVIIIRLSNTSVIESIIAVATPEQIDRLVKMENETLAEYFKGITDAISDRLDEQLSLWVREYLHDDDFPF